MQAYDGDLQPGWGRIRDVRRHAVTLSMRSDEQKSLYLKNLFEETLSRTSSRATAAQVAGARRPGRRAGLLHRSPDQSSQDQGHVRQRAASGISTNTIMQYIGHLEDAFVIEEAERFNVKGRKYIGSPKKCYFEDVGLHGASTGVLPDRADAHHGEHRVQRAANTRLTT